MVECSTEELLCLHLATGESEPGIASTPAVLDALGVGEGAVTSQFEVISGLSTLEKRGFIETRSTRIEDAGEERTAYELTDAGREYAHEVETRVSDRTVTVETDGEREVLTLAEAADRFEGSLATDGDAGLEQFEKAIELFDDLDDPVGERRCRALLGAAEIDRGDVREGRQKLDAALPALGSTGMVPLELEVLRRHAEVELARGNVDRVEELCDRARERIAATDASLGYERERIESLCHGLL